MQDNIREALKRDEDLNDIKDKAENMDQDAKAFKRTGEKLKWKMCCKNAKWTAIVIITLIAVIAVIVVAAVCSDGKSCK